MTAWYRALATRPLPPDPATTAEQIAADNVVESSTYGPSEAHTYIPGIVADDGLTDNYAAITAYLATLTSGGQNNLVLPPGYIGVGTSIVPPVGVILRGSGYSNSRISGGTFLCVMRTNTIASGHGVVDLSNNYSGVDNLNIVGMNKTTYALSSYALHISAFGNTFNRVGLAMGGLACLHTATTAGTTTGTHWFAGQGPSSNSLTVRLEGIDGLYGNFAAGALSTTGGSNQFDNFHLVEGPSGILTLPLVYETGNNLFTNGYFDSVLSATAGSMIDRSAATKPSRYAACFWYQNVSPAVTGIPVFKETGTAGAGADIDGFVSYPFVGASTFTYFIQNPIASTTVRVNAPAAAFTGGFTNNALGSVVNSRTPALVGPGYPSTVDTGILRATDFTALAANQAIFLRVRDGGQVSKIGIEVVTTGGNISVAAYSNTGFGRTAAPGVRLATSGAVSGFPAGYQEIALGSSVTVAPGDWLCVTSDNATTSFRSNLSGCVASGLGAGRGARQDAAHPAPTTPAPYAVIGGSIVLIGVP